MRYRNKTKSMRVVLGLIVGLTTSLFVLGLSNAQHAEGFNSHKGRFWKAEPVGCGDEITTYTVLTNDLDCSEHSGSPALTLGKRAKLNLNGYRVIGNSGINCIEMTGRATVRNGTVMSCRDGILINQSDRNKIIDVEACKNDRRGFKIDQGDENILVNCSATDNGRQGISIEKGNDNLVIKCSATDNGRQGISIEKGDGNKVYNNKANANCRDGIEIDRGSDNRVFYNHVEDNGNKDTCDAQAPDEDYRPWFYAGIDVTDGSEEYPSEYNEIKYNYACGNLGCDGSNSDPCLARERNFWDENVDVNGYCVSKNEWENNTVCMEPECTPGS
jgi:parallel beta-helix repeat protein